MKKISAVLLLIVASVFACSLCAEAGGLTFVEDVVQWQIAEGKTPSVPQYGTLAKNVNLRETPGLNGKKVGNLSGSTVVSLASVYLNGDDTPWQLCWVDDLHRLAWAYGKYIKRERAPDPLYAFQILMNADLAVSDSKLERDWGKVKKVKKLPADEMFPVMMERTYDKLEVCFFADGPRSVQNAMTDKTGGGFGCIWIGVKWCDRKFVRAYLGEPLKPEGEPNYVADSDNEWIYAGADGHASLSVSFAGDGTVKSLRYNYEP